MFGGCSEIDVSVTVKHEHVGSNRAFCLPRATYCWVVVC